MSDNKDELRKKYYARITEYGTTHAEYVGGYDITLMRIAEILAEISQERINNVR